MNWRNYLKSLDGVGAAELVVVDKLLEYYPFDTSDIPQNAEVLFALLLSVYRHQLQGNTCLPIPNIANKRLFSTSEKSDVTNESELVKPGILMPTLQEIISIFETWSKQQSQAIPFLIEHDRICVQRYYQYERDIAECIESISNHKLSIEIDDTGKQIFKHLFPIQRSTDWQAVAAANALQHSLMILNGGPGTGKTHTVARIMILLAYFFPSKTIQLAAPTGKAAQRLNESLAKNVKALAKHQNAIISRLANALPCESSTLHKLLGASISKTTTRRNKDNTLACDVLIIDEFSMVDTALFAKTLKACKQNIQLILVGDTAQLPSVEAGNLLQDLSRASNQQMSLQNAQFIQQFCNYQLATSGLAVSDHIVTLEQNHRSNQTINALADLINNQEAKALAQRLNQHQHLSIHKNDCDETEFYKTVETKMLDLLADYKSLLKTAETPEAVLKALSRFRILSPIRRGKYGVEGLNKRVCQALCSLPSYTKEVELFHGQAIIITENDYSSGLNNGDIGVIWNRQRKSNTNELIAVIERENALPLELSINRLPKFESAFALTIHKTQGSEYEQVLIVLPISGNESCTKELLYTAVTRAKKGVDIVATEQALRESLTRTNQRNTMLEYFLETKARV